MNKLFRKLTSLSVKPERVKKQWPQTYAFNDLGECVGTCNGVGKLSEFKGATLLNIVHRNGRTTVIKDKGFRQIYN